MQKFSRATPVSTKARSRVAALAIPVLLMLAPAASQAAPPPTTALFVITGTPASVTAGTSFNFTVTAYDQFNTVAAGYTGTVHFTSTDGIAVLPADYTFTAGDSGVHTFSATLKTAGSQTITVADLVTVPTITPGTATITVNAAAGTHFSVTAPATAVKGAAFNFTVTARDQFNNVATGYTGTVHFTSSDGAAVLPANATLTNGVGTFSATLNTNGNQTITATDTVTASITGTSNTILIDPPGGSAVPTLSEWNLALLGVLMAALAMRALKARPGAGAA